MTTPGDTLPVADSIRSRLAPGIRIYAFGDIHGRADLLFGKLRDVFADLRTSPHPAPLFVMLGDYIDRGGRSSHVIEMILILARRLPVVCLAGNHERYALRFLDDPASGPSWFNVGAQATIESYGVAVPQARRAATFEQIADGFRAALPASHLHFLRTLGTTFTLGDYVFVHGGLDPTRAIAETPPETLTMLRIRSAEASGYHGRTIVHGHTPVNRVDLDGGCINIDTGAYATGRLTCLALEGATRRLV